MRRIRSVKSNGNLGGKGVRNEVEVPNLPKEVKVDEELLRQAIRAKNSTGELGVI